MLAVDVRDLLPVGHAAFEFVELVRQFDLSAFTAAYRADGRGRPPFRPGVMVALLLYCRSKASCPVGTSRPRVTTTWVRG